MGINIYMLDGVKTLMLKRVPSLTESPDFQRSDIKLSRIIWIKKDLVRAEK